MTKSWRERARPTPRLVLVLACASGPVSAAASMIPVRAQDLCVTEGAIAALGDSRLAVDASKMRAYFNRLTRPVIDAHFTYLGATANDAPLGSGEMRRQFGLKLRAQDACNLVYVMWRIEPESKLVVSVKTNPGQHSSAQCGNRGYRNIKAQRVMPIPTLNRGDSHALRAELSGTAMRVFIDDSPVWEGNVGAEAAGLEGPVGVRSDNARLEIALLAGPALEGSSGEPRVCVASDAQGDSP